jgi:hypothetical protein
MAILNIKPGSMAELETVFSEVSTQADRLGLHNCWANHCW